VPAGRSGSVAPAAARGFRSTRLAPPDRDPCQLPHGTFRGVSLKSGRPARFARMMRENSSRRDPRSCVREHRGSHLLDRSHPHRTRPPSGQQYRPRRLQARAMAMPGVQGLEISTSTAFSHAFGDRAPSRHPHPTGHREPPRPQRLRRGSASVPTFQSLTDERNAASTSAVRHIEELGTSMTHHLVEKRLFPPHPHRAMTASSAACRRSCGRGS